MDKIEFLRLLAQATRDHVQRELAPVHERLIIDSDRLDHLEARIFELENKGEPGKLYEVKPKIHARV